MTGVFLIAVALLAGRTNGTAEGPAASARTVERALALRPAGAALDVAVFRDELGAGVVILARTEDGWSLRSFPGLGPEIEALAITDGNGDGLGDLLVQRSTGAVEIALGDGTTRFVPREKPAGGKAHHGHHGGDFRAGATLALAERDAAVAVLGRRGTAARADVPPDALSAVELDADSDGVADTAWVDVQGRIVLRTVGGVREIAQLPLDLAPRLLAVGEFGGTGLPDLVVIGHGERPRVALVEDLAANAGPGSDVGPAAVLEQGVNKAIVNVFVGQGDFVFNPATVNIQVNDTVHWIWSSSGHSVISGAGCTSDGQFCSPNDSTCETSLVGATYDRTFTSDGSFPYYCEPHCVLFGMEGTVNVQAAPAGHPGAVPDGDAVPGTPLRIEKAAGTNLLLSWGASPCSATTYAVYEGTLPIAGGAYDHVPLNCDLGDVTSADIEPGAGSRYYLLVPVSATAEGSYGTGNAGAQIPALAGACKAVQDLAACP